MASSLKQALLEHLSQLEPMDSAELLENRYQRLMGYGQFVQRN